MCWITLSGPNAPRVYTSDHDTDIEKLADDNVSNNDDEESLLPNARCVDLDYSVSVDPYTPDLYTSTYHRHRHRYSHHHNHHHPHLHPHLRHRHPRLHPHLPHLHLPHLHPHLYYDHQHYYNGDDGDDDGDEANEPVYRIAVPAGATATVPRYKSKSKERRVRRVVAGSDRASRPVKKAMVDVEKRVRFADDVVEVGGGGGDGEVRIQGSGGGGDARVEERRPRRVPRRVKGRENLVAGRAGAGGGGWRWERGGTGQGAGRKGGSGYPPFGPVEDW
ncbi:hypothetical protein EJ05DRAFT_518992 [Pseudovirgaria hyperparasitica]|uniref:Uncharacterized protein n=1 Tax=Pseudovirgaria hyperparasitica TaxID=470096 RepID=A0A6A6W3Z1_9PEZI|nr:uncharacterized protein EJ05DRAFT_518992 [Pseudovirgaria hyperparasitica]KAF2756277.1 hypothetical protein EJ05DRAFT_518992 [Pseudovirgaria hyperparasitica]